MGGKIVRLLCTPCWNFRFHNMREICWTVWETTGYSRRGLLHV